MYSTPPDWSGRGDRAVHAGAAGYDPRMLFALLVYAYCQGVRSSRQIERLCVTDVAFRVLCAQDGPDHATIARFRVDARDVFSDLFAQVLMVAATAGLGRFGTVAIDGTKIRANASIDANRGREWFEQRAANMLTEAERADQAEDCAAQTRGEQAPDRVPSELGDRARRRERIRLAAQELQAQHQRRARAEEEREAAALARRRRSEQGQPVVGRIPDGPHRLAEARAHLVREIAIHQTKLDRYAGLVAQGKKPMGPATGADGGKHQGAPGSTRSPQRRSRRGKGRGGRCEDTADQAAT